MIKRLLSHLDKLLCRYLGLASMEVKPTTVKLIDGQLFVDSTESHKRHLHSKEWGQFSQQDLHKMSEQNKQKLGLALGKVIAKNLVISFDRPEK
jgi:hypothetical protein